MKKVLVLGTVLQEVPLVEAFKSLGYYVITVGMDPEYPCCSLADKNYIANIMDKKKMLEIAKQEGVVAIATNVVERAVRVAAWVSEQLGLEGIGYEVAKRFTNKYLMRQYGKKVGVFQPDFASVTTLEAAKKFAKTHQYPLMIKPVDNGGSKGVVKIYSESELEEKFYDSLSKSVFDNAVIVEEFIEGKEYIVNAFTHNYICDATDVATKETFDIRNLCIVKNVVMLDADSCNTTIEKMLISENKKLVEGFGLKFGITHANYIYSEEKNKVYLVEITARGGGDFISSDLLKLSTGIDASNLLALYSLGFDPIGEKLHLEHGAAAWLGFLLPEGEIISIKGMEEVKHLEGVYRVIDKGIEVGEKTKQLIDLSGKYGPILISGKNRLDCYRIMNEIKEKLQISVKTEDGIKGIIW